MSVVRFETSVDCLEKGGYSILQGYDKDRNQTFNVCTVVIGSNWYRFENGILKQITSTGKDLEICDMIAANEKHDTVMEDFKNGNCLCSYTTYLENDNYTIHPDHISCYSLLCAAKMREQYPNKTIYFQGREYPLNLN